MKYSFSNYNLLEEISSLSHFVVFLWGFPDSSVGQEYTSNAGDPGLIPGSGRSVCFSQYLCIDHQERISCLSLLRYADDTTLMAESEGELKSLLMKVKEESEKVGLKLNIQ